MNITIYKAEKLPGEYSSNPEFSYQLPPGFPFLVDDDKLEVVEPALLYLSDRFIKNGESGEDHTRKAVAYDLCDWWNFLAEEKRPWNTADTDLILKYHGARLKTISPQTHETLASNTVRRRIMYVCACYEWANGKGWVDVTGFAEKVKKAVNVSIDADFFAHTRSGHFTKEVFRLLPRTDTGRRRPASYLTVDHWRTLARELGPLPSEARETNDPRPSRDRLASELSVSTGLRVDEVAKLTKYQILDLVAQIPLDAEPDQLVSLNVTKTKRLVARGVDIPVYLIHELVDYIDNERAAAVDAARKTWLTKRAREPSSLFLNCVDAKLHAGKAINADTFDAAFRKAQFAAGLVRTVEKKDPDTGEDYVTKDTRYVFHSLHHTFAMWLYDAERQAGNAEPWKIVQSKLGHASLKTTMDTYLAHFDGRRRAVNRATFEGIRSKYNGN